MSCLTSLWAIRSIQRCSPGHCRHNFICSCDEAAWITQRIVSLSTGKDLRGQYLLLAQVHCGDRLRQASKGRVLQHLKACLTLSPSGSWSNKRSFTKSHIFPRPSWAQQSLSILICSRNLSGPQLPFLPLFFLHSGSINCCLQD